MTDYEVKTSISLDTGFDDRENNRLMFEDRKRGIIKDIKSVFESDKTLTEYIAGDLDFQFDGYKVKVEYIFTCNDENEAEAESFSNYCVNGIQNKLEELGYGIKQVTCKASEMDMEWLNRLEGMWFG